jgi:hypothetical protein
MKRTLLFTIFCLLSIHAVFAAAARKLTNSEITKVKEAICDEIYDYGLSAEFYQIGENVGTPEHWKSQVRIYIDPMYSSDDQHGRLIYKLMPYGQIYRFFFIGDDGRITLDGNPQNRFPITQPSHQTVYMDEEEVRQYEQSWIKSTFTIDTQPTAEMIRSAAERQKKRTGFSDWEYKQASEAEPKK